LRVALDWTLDLLFSKDLVQFQTFRSPTISMREEGRGKKRVLVVPTSHETVDRKSVT